MPVSAEGRPPKRRVVALAGIVCSMALLFSVAISRGTASWSLTISPEPATDRFQLMSEVPAAAGAVSLFRSVNATGSSLRVRAPWQLTTLPVQAGMPNDTAIIMAYFNPVKWTRPSMNMHKTRAMLITQGASLYTIELLYPNRTPEVPPGPGVLHVHTRSIMWHKENLLTILERRLPSQYTKVIWVVSLHVGGIVIYHIQRVPVKSAGLRRGVQQSAVDRRGIRGTGEVRLRPAVRHGVLAWPRPRPQQVHYDQDVIRVQAPSPGLCGRLPP